eukprot:s4190_g4.t1
MKLMKHLVGYLWGTQDYGVNLHLAPGKSVMQLAQGKVKADAPIQGHLVEGYSDSNFANDRATRKSLSSGQIYIDQALMYSFVRGQKVVTLSAGEAELVALTQTTSEAILVHKAWQWTAREEAELVMRSDSSVARAIASRLGVGRVRHLQTSCLWIQQWVLAKTLRVAPVPTQFNPSDMGTKSLPQRRLRMLCFLAGVVDDRGNPVGQEEHAEALGREVFGRQGGELMVRIVQALLMVTMQGCTGTEQDTVYAFQALAVYFAEMILTSPVLIAVAIGIYMVTATHWNIYITAGSRRQPTADKAVQVEPEEQPAPPRKESDRSESSTLSARRESLRETLTYEDLFEGLGPATQRAPDAPDSERPGHRKHRDLCSAWGSQYHEPFYQKGGSKACAC